MNAKVYKWCAVPECKNTTIKTPNKVFVHVPNNKSVRNKWFKLARRNPTSVVKNSQLYFCEDHFDLPNDMANYMQYHVMGSVSQVRMKPGCLPRKFACQPDRKNRTSDATERPYVAKKRRLMIIEECEKEWEEQSIVTKQSSAEEIASSSSGNFINVEVPQLTPRVLGEATVEDHRPSRLSTERNVQHHESKFPCDKHMHQKRINIIRKQRSEDGWMPSNSSTVCSDFESDMKCTTPMGRLKLKISAAPVTKLAEPMTQPGASGNSSYEATHQDQESLDSNAGLEDPLATEAPNTTPQCRFCAEYCKDCIDVTNQDRPYLTRNKTALTINDLTVELDFNNDALPKTVCEICDRKLQAMCDFFKQVKDAQDSLINFRDNVKEDIGNLTVKTECESPIPEDDDIIDSKDGIVDSLTVCETVFVKPYTSKHKRKGVEDTPKTQKKTKVTKNVEIKSKESELIINIKEEPPEVAEYEAEKNEINDTKQTKHKTNTVETKTVTESSEFKLQTRALVSNINENVRYNNLISELGSGE